MPQNISQAAVAWWLQEHRRMKEDTLQHKDLSLPSHHVPKHTSTEDMLQHIKSRCRHNVSEEEKKQSITILGLALW